MPEGFRAIDGGSVHRARHAETPLFDAQRLSAQSIDTSSGPVYKRVQLFFRHGCENCHTIGGRADNINTRTRATARNRN
jgi:hypothetical protein